MMSNGGAPFQVAWDKSSVHMKDVMEEKFGCCGLEKGGPREHWCEVC